MKKILMSLICISTLFLSSCDTETTGNVSRVTVFPEISINGDGLMYSEVGQPFADPGANASVAGSPVDFQTSSNIDTNTPGFYTVVYSVENEDGFSASALRTVIIYENNGSVAGIYDGIRIGRVGGPILVTSRGDGRFNVSDLMGGYYEFGVLYGNAYAFPAIITVDVPGGTVTSAAGGVGGFGPCALSAGTVTADGKTMSWTATLTAYAFGFDVLMTKVTP